MKNIRILAVFVGMIASLNFASAATIRGINIDFVTIGNAGNVADTSGTLGGVVDYDYKIGKYEVTNAQWNAFTAVAGTPTGNPSTAYDKNAYWTGAQQPTNNVSWYEAAQFCNWLTSGDKSKGAYQFSGNNTNPGSFLGIDRVSSNSTYGTTYVIPTEDEWYKAAYFKPDGSGYSLYANGTNTRPIAGLNSNYNSSAPWDITNGTPEQNGTFDMMGNVEEWNETLFNSSYRGVRGGSYIPRRIDQLWSFDRGSRNPSNQSASIGFRIAFVPGPAVPIANAGEDQVVFAASDSIAEVTLDGSDSNDPEGNELTYKWTWTIDANAYEANGVSPTIELPVGLHTIQLIVNNGFIDSAPNDVNITVIAAVETNVRIIPGNIHLLKGQSEIRANIQLPYSVDENAVDFNEPFILWPGEIEATKQRISSNKILAFFDKTELANNVLMDGSVEVIVEGKLKSGQCFYGTDTVRINR